MPDGIDRARELAARRDAARRARDFATADALRDEIAALGFRVVDGPTGAELEPFEAAAPRRLHPRDVASVLDEPPSAPVTVQWVVEGWPEDVVRAIASFRANVPAPDMHLLVVDVAGTDLAAFPDGVEVVALEGNPGWGAARAAALRRSRGAVVVIADGSVEATGDAIGPLLVALEDPSVGVVEAVLVDPEPLHRPRRDRDRRDRTGFEGELVANPAQQPVGDARDATAAGGEIADRLVFDREKIGRAHV